MKDFDPKQKSEGLGDTVAKFTHAVKLDKVVDKVAKIVGMEDCGCNRRRKKLNEMVSYKKDKDDKKVS